MQEAGGVTGPGLEVAGWSVDSRTLAAGDLYFALRGPSHDGHDYVGEATRTGAAGVVVAHAIDGAQNALILAETIGALAPPWGVGRRAGGRPGVRGSRRRGRPCT